MNITEDRRARAIELRAQGKTLKQISQETGLSVSYINRLTGIATARPRVSRELREAVAADYGRGMTLTQIAAKHGRSKSAISKWISSIAEEGDKTGPEARREAKALEIRELWRQGLNVAEIARRTSSNHDTVRELVQGSHGGPGIFTERDILASIERYQAGETIEAIAGSLQRSVNTISRWLHENDVDVLSSIERRSPEDQRRYSQLGVEANQAKAELTAHYRVCAREGCNEEFRLRTARDRTMYHSRECACLARTDPDKRVTFTCRCGVTFEDWANRPRVYHSRECWAKYAPNAERSVAEGNQFDSPWEAFFYGLCSLAKVEVKRHDRADVVEWTPGRYYAPDFDMAWRGRRVCIEIKGHVRDHDDPKWRAWRKLRCPLVVLREDDLYNLSPAGLREVLDKEIPLVTGSHPRRDGATAALHE